MQWVDAVLADGQHATQLREDLEYFSEHALRIRPKSGPLAPLCFNAAQRKLHQILEDQRKKTGRVRAIVLKARQLGVSTYVAARYFHKTIHNPGVRTFILGHERPASRNLFSMVKRFQDGMPDDLRPSIGTSNADELIFDKMDSGYLVGVATEQGAGRSATAQLLHASETAFWPDLPVQLAALMQIVPDMPGTEIILESTAFGFNDFHKLWRKAESGDSDFITVFLPWTIDPMYRRDVPADFKPDAEESDLIRLHALTNEQLAWRRAKISELGAPELFQQEYPLIASEAWVSSSFDSFIPSGLVIKARREKVEPYGGLVLGCDPAHKGPDRTSIAWRRGRCIEKVVSRRGLDTMQTCGWINQLIRDEKPMAVYIDVGGIGAGIYDRLIELGHKRSVVRSVNFGGKPVEPPAIDELGNPAGGPANRRAEMWLNLKKALEGERFQLPDSDSLQADLVGPGYKFTSDGRLLLESKDDMRKRGVPSPDEGDAVALCFADGPDMPRSRGFSRDLNAELEKRYGGIYV